MTLKFNVMAFSYPTSCFLPSFTSDSDYRGIVPFVLPIVVRRDIQSRESYVAPLMSNNSLSEP